MTRALDLGELTIGDRIRELIGKRSVNACAEAWELPVTTLRQNLSGSMPRADTAARIAEANDVSVEWLITGKGQKLLIPPTLTDNGETLQLQDVATGDLTFVPRYDVKLSSGTGKLIAAEDIFEHLAFRTSWLREMGIAPQHAALVTNEGDSNEPTIPDGALMLLDLSIREVSNGKFYALRRDGELLIKRIQRRFDGTVVLKSDNPRYDDEEIPENKVVDLHVIGRLKWVARSI